ncbi:hypothetical protein BMS_0772 [Halobacteriovorax marinus SJ]|uniref:SF4 helicase domain-containing protein n=1 Tax=Halobacteriovorax marinus (strain ATCC BAA-682 / DSM 15412 / SJ) TaxID=862908 RepID=E1X5V8_HALMS|nr:hypothetical protein [Halobacteriovorax marinus]CBW25675.1 hypothetical protein BMS_0772 [Halobacteriovorax marinus SJ]
MKNRKFKEVKDIRFMLEIPEEVKQHKEAPNKYSLNTIKISENNKEFKTKYKFLKAHNGLQAGHIHLLLGRTNKGKSTLIHSLMAENSLNGYRVLLFLSEGNKSDIKEAIEPVLDIKARSEKDKQELLERILLIDRNDISDEASYCPRIWVKDLFKVINEQKIDILYIDNFSTSSYGDSAPEVQANLIQILNRTAQRYLIPVFGAIHQAKSVSPDKELSLIDIRSNSAFMNISSFIYAINDFYNLDKSLRILKILKSRKYSEAIDKYFELTYKKVKRQGFYSKNMEITEQTAKRYFVENSRRRLSGRN